MGESVAKYSPGSPYGYPDWCEALTPVVGASMSDCGASHARSGDTVFGVPSSSIITESVVDERRQNGPSLQGSNLENESFAIRLAAVTANSGWLT